MPRPVVIRIETTATLTGIDQLQTRLNALRETISRLGTGAESAKESLKDVAASVSSLNRTAGSAADKVEALADAMDKLRTSTTATNTALGSTDNLMRAGAAAASQYAAAVKAAAAGQREWNAANKGRKTSFMGPNAENVPNPSQGGPTQWIAQYAALESGIKALPAGINNVARAASSAQAPIRGLNNGILALGAGADYIDAEFRIIDTTMTRTAQATLPLNRNILQLTDGLHTVTRPVTTLTTQMIAFASAVGSRVVSGLQSLTGALQSGLARLLTWLTSIQRVISLLRTFGTIVAGAMRAAQAAVGGFVRAASSSFAGLQRAVQGIQNSFRNFGQRIGESFQTAQRHMRDFYNAGWSLLTSGRAFQNVGQQMWGGLSGMFEGYMAFEKTAVRTAISASTNIATIQKMVFGLQRGAYTDQPIMQFNAEELAQGLYYFTSAIGTAVTDDNMAELAKTVGSIMQVAAATQTSLETTTKGVLNAAMEFGIQPRDLEKGGEAARVASQQLTQIAAQFGYLANLTTMEVPDIAEAFKMVGPLMHVLAGDEAGAGLPEAFGLIALASDVGLRGGNVGRGINQALQTILDPTNPAIEAAAQAFGIGASEEAWRAFFLNSDDTLQGGVEGLFQKLRDLTPSEMAKIFTTNASRALIGIMEAAEDFSDEEFGEGLEGFFAMMRDPDASMKFLSEATAQNANTIAANWQNMQNAWFAVQAEIIGAIKGTLIPIMFQISEVIWQIGDVIRDNPWIGELVVGFLSIASAVAIVVGSLMMVGGSLLLVMKAFSLLGAISHPYLLFFASMGTALLTIVPLLAALGAGIVVFRRIWEDNLFEVQDRVAALREEVEFFFSTLDTTGPKRIGQAFHMFEDLSLRGAEAIYEWAVANETALREVVRLVRVAARAFVDGFTAMIGSIAAVGFAIYTFINDNIVAFSSATIDLIEGLTGVQMSAEDLATTIGTILGGAVALAIAQHFIPAIAFLVAFRVGALALNVALTTLAVTFGVVSRAIAGIAALAGAIGAVVSTLGLLGTIGAVAFVALAAAIAFLLIRSEEFRQNVQMILSAIWDGLQPAFEAIGRVAVIAFGLIVMIVQEAAEYFAEHTEQVKQAAAAVGVTLVVAFTLLAAAIIAVIGAVTLLAMAFVHYFGGENFAGLLGDIVEDMTVLMEYLTLEHINWDLVGAMLGARLAQWGALLSAALLEALGDAVRVAFEGLGDTVDTIPGMRDALRFTPFGPILDLADSAGQQFDRGMEALAETTRAGAASLGSVASSARIIMSDAADEVAEGGSQFSTAFDDVNIENIEDIYKTLGDLVTGGPGGVSLAEGILGGLDLSLDDYEGMSLSDFTSSVIGDENKVKSDMDLFRDYTMRFGQQATEWNNYQKKVAEMGQSAADEFYKVYLQAPIPTEPEMTFAEFKLGTRTRESYNAMMGQARADVEEMSEEMQAFIEEASAKFTEAVKAPSFSLADAMMAVFGPSGDSGTAVYDALLQYGDQMIQNIGDAGPWLNLTELMADAAISGDLGTALTGNLHEALRPHLELVARQTGKSIDEILKDVPKYMAPEQYMPMATAELLEALDVIPQAIAERIDTLGVDIGKTTQGIDWTEVAQFAVAQGPDTDWNLVDYLTSSWNMTVEEVENYLASHGIAPDTISGAMFGDTQALINAAGGTLPVLSDEWYQFLQENIADGDTILEMTQRQFDQIPDYIKAIYAQMGYSFVIGGEDLASDILSANEAVFAALQNSVEVIDTATGQVAEKGGAKAFWEKFWEDAGADGEINRQGMQVVHDTVNGLTTVTDTLTGMTITLPTTDYQDALNSAREAGEVAAELERLEGRLRYVKERLRGLQDMRDFLQDEDSTIFGVDLPDWLRRPLLSNIDDTIDERKAELDRIREALGWTVGEDGVSQMPVQITFDDTSVSTESAAALTTVVEEAVSAGLEDAFTFDVGTVDLEPIKTLGTTTAESFKTAFEAAMVGWNPMQTAMNAQIAGERTAAGGSQSADGQIYSDAPVVPTYASVPQSITVDIVADATAANTTIGNLNTALARFEDTTWTTKIMLDHFTYTEVWNSKKRALLDFDGATYTGTLDLDTALFATAWAPIPTAINSFSGKTFTATLAGDNVPFLTAWQAAYNAGSTFDGAWFTATLGGNNAPFMQAWQAAWNAGAAFEQKVFTATLATVDTNPQRQAVGGLSTSPLQWVGEEGPELAAMPFGTRVQSTGRSMRMLTDAVASAISPRDMTPVTATSEFKQAANWLSESGSKQGDVHVEINNLNIAKEVDIDHAYQRMQALMGRDNAMAERGMIPLPPTRTL